MHQIATYFYLFLGVYTKAANFLWNDFCALQDVAWTSYPRQIVRGNSLKKVRILYVSMALARFPN